MAYLTFAEYEALGGKITSSSFSNLERKARRKLDYFTQDRLTSLTVISSDIKECMADFIDKISISTENGNITSYSNGIESISYSENQTDALNDELYQIAIEYLPIEYITTYVYEV
jgi:hypothetical protein